MSRVIDTNVAAYAPLGIYVHIPFCVRKCRYCDFISYAGKACDERSLYIDSLCREIKEKGALYKDKYYADSVFFGGGTPTVLDADEIIKILDCIDENFILGCENARVCGAGLKGCDGLEISIEANPGTIDRAKLQSLKEHGFNRISIGVQSFDDKVLTMLGRIHSANEAEEAVKLAKSMGYMVNIDLMFGVPGQDAAIWQGSLMKAISLKPEHISFYSLQLEEGTALYNDYRFGSLAIPSWEENREMYHAALRILNENGYEHYEISNACKPGFECRHNLKYWSMQEYLGFGLAAHSYMGGKRFFNEPDAAGELKYHSVSDENSDEKGDFIFTRLRLIEGFPKKEYYERFGTDFEAEYKGFYDPEMLSAETDMIKLTKKGLDYTNPVMERLINR